MDFDKFDKDLKDNIKEKYGEVPDSVNKRIDDVLNSLDKKNHENNGLNRNINKKKRKITLKRIAIACGAIIVMAGAGITTTAIAKDIPIKDVIYEILGMDNENTEYADAVGQVKEKNGIKVTIVSTVFDGYVLKTTYRIESEKKISDMEFMESCKIKGTLGTGAGGGRSEAISDNEVVGVFEWSFDEAQYNVVKGLEPLKNEKIEFSIRQHEVLSNSEIGGPIESWNFIIPVSSIKMEKDIKTYKVNKKFQGAQIKEILVTPTDIRIFGVTDKGIPEVKLKDKNGTVTEIGGSQMDNAGSGKFIFRMDFENKFKDLKELEIINVEGKNESIKIKLEE